MTGQELEHRGALGLAWLRGKMVGDTQYVCDELIIGQVSGPGACVTLRNCTLENVTFNGTQLGWGLENCTLVNCTIAGTWVDLKATNTTFECCDFSCATLITPLFDEDTTLECCEFDGTLVTLHPENLGHPTLGKVVGCQLQNSIIEPGCLPMDAVQVPDSLLAKMDGLL